MKKILAVLTVLVMLSAGATAKNFTIEDSSNNPLLQVNGNTGEKQLNNGLVNISEGGEPIARFEQSGITFDQPLSLQSPGALSVANGIDLTGTSSNTIDSYSTFYLTTSSGSPSDIVLQPTGEVGVDANLSTSGNIDLQGNTLEGVGNIVDETGTACNANQFLNGNGVCETDTDTDTTLTEDNVEQFIFDTGDNDQGNLGLNGNDIVDTTDNEVDINDDLTLEGNDLNGVSNIEGLTIGGSDIGSISELNSAGGTLHLQHVGSSSRVEIGAGSGSVTTDFNSNPLVNAGSIELDSTGDIRVDGTDAIRLDGSQNVDIPNGNLNMNGNSVDDVNRIGDPGNGNYLDFTDNGNYVEVQDGGGSREQIITEDTYVDEDGFWLGDEDLVNINAGTDLSGGGTNGLTDQVTINHADTSSQSNVATSGGTIIDDIDLDGRGHLTNINTRNIDSRYINVGESGDSLSDDTVDNSEIQNSDSFTFGGITNNGNLDMSNNNIDDVASIDGGGDSIQVRDAVNLNNNDISGVNGINIQDAGTDGDISFTSNARIYNAPLDDSNSAGYLQFVNDDGIAFEAGGDGTTQAVINSNGRMGIGTTTPQEDLDVNGDVRIRGNLDIWGNIQNTDVQNLNINGSLIPPSGYDATFDVGSSSRRWRDGHFSGTVTAANFEGTGGESISDKYVDESGDTMTGNLDMGSNRIVSVADPNNAQDVATKSYVDSSDNTGTDNQDLGEVLNQGNSANQNIDMNGNSVQSVNQVSFNSDEEITDNGDLCLGDRCA